MNEIEKILRDLKGAHRLTAKQIADELGVTQVTVSGWKRGTVSPRAQHLERLRALHSKYMAGVDVPEGTARKPIDRDDAIVRMHRRGDSLQEIGDIFGLTRERVRQIVAAKGG